MKISLFMYVCMYGFVYYRSGYIFFKCMYVSIYVCMYVSIMYVCMYDRPGDNAQQLGCKEI